MRAVPMLVAAIAAFSSIGRVSAAEDTKAPYAGQQSRDIKALSDADVAALRNGEGMGFAKAAELNNYPGPRHALDTAAELGLSGDQRRRLEAVYERMNGEARALGAALIERERALDGLFAGGTVSPESLAAETARIAAIQGRLRTVHLMAHLETRALLGPDQIARYNRLRGYDGPADAGHGRKAGHRH